MNKVQDEIKKQNNPKPIKKLRPLKPVSSTAKPSDSTAKPVNKTVKPLKSTAKPVVNYDIEKIPEEKPVKKEETKKPEKIKPEKSKPEKKGFFESVKDMMYASADDDNEEEKESEEKEFKVETIEEIKPAPENISKEIPEDKPAEPVKEKSDTKKPENEKSDTKKSPEQVSEPEKKSNNNGNRKNKKKNKNQSQQKNNTVASKKPEESRPEEPEKPDTKKSEKSEPKKSEKTDTKKSEKSEPKKSEKPDTKKSEKSEPKKSEKPDTKQSEKTEPKKSGQTDVSAIPLLNGKYNFITLLGITIIILILILGIRSCANGKASDEKYRQAIYPAVITDINEFENASELPVSQILSTAVWSVIIDNEKLSAYPQRVDDMAIIPAEDIEKYATEIFGEDIPELTHNTILTADSKFYYNEEADSYTVEVTPHTVTYKPEVVSVTNRNGKYIVDVNYIDQYPEWIEDTVAKTAEYVLSKNGDGGYVIESMHETSETETVSTTTEATSEEEISQENMSVTTE